ncbi:MAG TPA: GH1 family beta-glucosidase [Symbiobacteriaceae bacterium]|nr:GH1 family beta-glucosidase [Symbiobacteriaceae bacterium]
MQFPKDFVWGAATASYQIEGAAWEDGRGECVWDRFCRQPGTVANADNGDVACDHYHRYGEDIDLMAELGLRSYRFSIAWPRIFPNGKGTVNQKGIDFYKRVVDKLLSRGIVPCATIYHWDLPQALEFEGGWGNRATAEHFTRYAETMFRALGDVVPQWTTHNEPFCASYLGYGMGVHAPGLQNWHLAVKASHHLLLSHGWSVQSFRQLVPQGQIGLTLNMSGFYPATDSEADRWAAHRFDGWHHRWFFAPLFKGAYPADMLEYYGTFGPMDYILPDDLATIHQPLDFLGINYYTRAILKGNANSPWLGGVEAMPKTAPVTDQDWEIVPDCLYDLLTRVRQDWTGTLPLYIHENGCAMPDVVSEDGRVHDVRRTEYIHDHLMRVHKAIEAGVPVKGYYVWSLLDNFEWAWGYDKRFGIVYVDYETQKRILKDSALWFASVAKTGELAPVAGAIR